MCRPRTSCSRCASNEGDFAGDMPLSASVRAEIARDGTLHRLQGQIFADAGTDRRHGPEQSHSKIDRAELRFNWDAGSAP